MSKIERIRVRLSWWFRDFLPKSWELISKEIRIVDHTPSLTWEEISLYHHIPTDTYMREQELHKNSSLF